MKGYMKFTFFLFSVISILTTVVTSQANLFFSSFIQSGSNRDVSAEMLMRMISSENHYFHQRTESADDSIIHQALQVATNINIKDVRSLIYEEIPGMFTMSSDIVVAGEGTDFTNLPIESSPPIEELLKEREVKENSLGNIDGGKPKAPAKKPDKNTVFIYHSHNRESFIPHLKDTNSASSAQHKEINITLVGTRLGEKLIEKGIGTVVDTTDIASILLEKGWEYWQSYDASREVVKEAMANNKNFVYFFDIHRDALRRKATTTTIDGKNYAKIYFVVGKSHPNYKENEKFALSLNRLIEEKYPSLTRGISRKDKTTGNGIYNQDLSERSLIIEIGGPENTLEEMYNTADVLAEIFAQYYFQDAVEVNG